MTIVLCPENLNFAPLPPPPPFSHRFYGKDSSTALSIITLLKTITLKGMIVVCSIHQPRSNIFSEFDKVLLLSKGKTAYYGARGSIVKYFLTIGKRGLFASLFLRTNYVFVRFVHFFF